MDGLLSSCEQIFVEENNGAEETEISSLKLFGRVSAPV